MNDNLQRLSAQVESLCATVDELLASSQTTDCSVLQAKLVVQRDIVKATIYDISKSNEISELTYDVEKGVWK